MQRLLLLRILLVLKKLVKNKIINDLLEIAFDQIYPSLSESQKQAFDSFSQSFWMVRSQANYDQVRRNSIERLYSTRRTK